MALSSFSYSKMPSSSGSFKVQERAGTGITTAIHAAVRRVPTAGSHTYTVKAYGVSAGNNLIVKAGPGGAGQLVPGFVRVSRG